VLHARSEVNDALPVLLLHGYPSSPVEYLDLIGPLTDPAGHGGDPADAFHVVVPSLPGFGFSSPVREPGWEVGRTTDAYAELMRQLGYERYGVVGSDIGAGVAGRLSALHGDHVVGALVVSETAALGVAGEQFPVPDHLTPEDRERVAVEQARWREERGYLVLQTTRPETIGVALTDSPLAQLAWVAEKLDAWTGPSSAVDRDLLLATVSLLWFTRSGAGAARFLWEAAHSELDWLSSADVPTGWAVFGADPVVRRFMDPEGHLAFWSEHAEGGHFPALEVPELLTRDVRAFFRSLR
jgi:pimeloyl-ACP methyl ester carboxylesterase